MKHNNDFIERLNQLYLEQFEKPPKDIKLLPPSGSERRYVRFTDADGATVLGVYNPDRAENNTFFYFSGIFAKNELPVPEILATGSEKQTYLIEDLGTQTLYDIIAEEGHSERVKKLLKKTIDQLVRFHWQAGTTIDYSICYSSNSFDEQQILADLLYFKYYFVDPLALKYNKATLIEDLTTWSKELAAKRPRTFMYRDFQSRNVMVKEDEVYFIDYQGGMYGLPAYDLASLLWQARAQFPESWKTELLNYYFVALEKIPENSGLKETEFRKTYLECVLLRMLQTLGAYGFRGLIQRKEIFVQSIIPALKQLSVFLDEYPQYPPYNELRKLLDELVRPEIIDRFKPVVYSKEKLEKLQVEVYSFSYKKGIPVDETEHGGGFVFDCRGILNPGRIEQFKTQTGKQDAVKAFLEQNTKMPEFLEGAFRMVDISVNNYLERDFDHLTIAFGCTGGQHRSVYAAEAMAEHLRKNFGLSPVLVHLEQEENKVARR